MFYHKLADRVVDGTPCHDDPSRRCVHGQCKSIGCDWKVGSYKQTDQCGVCGGDGSSCLGGGEVTGTFHQQRLSPGYLHQIKLITLVTL
ncbi:PPN1-like protein [Mya arenaria]|uniref:PPN1-like protein n=1 Tax=Mya arenaria TaxID=6604 RepID=A0ABY7FCF4_MYAAR|nr:PPN1-like protein [Mya arenaria]WAR20636.1 PPN1-like protein [Mya arenaria]